MKETGSAAFAKLDLRRLWPVVSTTLYPETLQRVHNVHEDIRSVGIRTEAESCSQLACALEKLQEMLEQHHSSLKQTVASRLTVHPYGSQTVPEGYFSSRCDDHFQTTSDVKLLWTQIRALARTCFGRVNSSAAEKLVLARLNSIEQDVLYVLFVEKQYICPLILKPTR